MNKPNYKILGNSLEVQWLELCAVTAEGTGSIPGWGTGHLSGGSHSFQFLMWPSKDETAHLRLGL